MASTTFSSNWHRYDEIPRSVSGTLTANYSGLTITASCSFTYTMHWDTAYSDYYDTAYLQIDGNNVGTLTNVPMTRSGSYSVSGSRTVTAGNHTIRLRLRCGDPGCDSGYYSSPVTVGSLTLNVPNPYTAYTLSISSVTSIVRVGRDSVTVRYTLSGGTDTITTCQLRVYSGSTLIQTISISTSKSSSTQTATFTPSTSTYSHGSSYSVCVYATDGTTTKTTSRLTFYTYQEPTLTGVSVANASPQNANTANTFTLSGTNNRKWSSYESAFVTQYRIQRSDGTYTSWTSLGNVTTWSRTAANMRSLIPKAYDATNNTFYFRRYSSSASWYSSTYSVAMMLYYRPLNGITSSAVTYKMNSSSGTVISQGEEVINTTSLDSIYVSWTYDTTVARAGYTQGYRVRLYDYEGNLINTYYTTSKYVSIPKSDIPRMNMTYIDITPYYGNDSNSTSDYWYYNGTIERIEFIQLVSQLEKPVITYPVQGTTWLNKDFRVCFTLPADPDKGSEPEDYRYENIELKVNNTVYSLIDTDGVTDGAIIDDTIFSCLSDELTYQRPVVIYPNLLGNIEDSTTYSVQVRVKKKYASITPEYRWSDWSDTKIFYVSIPQYEVETGDLIMATHYNDALSLVDNTRSVYDVDWSNKPSQVTAKYTTIQAAQYSYSTIMGKIVETKYQVNNYAEFDTERENVKFDYENNLLESFNEQVGEVVTALQNEGNEYNGRNYIHFIYNNCRLLK